MITHTHWLAMPRGRRERQRFQLASFRVRWQHLPESFISKLKLLQRKEPWVLRVSSAPSASPLSETPAKWIFIAGWENSAPSLVSSNEIHCQNFACNVDNYCTIQFSHFCWAPIRIVLFFVQWSAERWVLGCVNSPPPRIHGQREPGGGIHITWGPPLSRFL